MFENLKKEYRSTLKSSDTEENIDLFFYRPIGFAWACFFRRLHIHPNAVTIASMFLGIGAAICFYYSNVRTTLAGMLLLVWANSYDSADGQLARMTHRFSKIGRILDGAAGDVWFVSIYVAICLRTVRDVPFFHQHSWIIWVLAILAGLCHARQAATADYYRQAHLFFLKGKKGSELDSSTDIEIRYRENKMRSRRFNALVDLFYLGYTRMQERSTPHFQRLRNELRGLDEQSPRYSQISDRFLPLSFPLCKWENFMTFNWRCITLFVCLLLNMPWVYFVVELTIFNVVLLYTTRKHENICRKVLEHTATEVHAETTPQNHPLNTF